MTVRKILFAIIRHCWPYDREKKRSKVIDTRVMDGATKIDLGKTLAAMASDGSLEIEEDKEL